MTSEFWSRVRRDFFERERRHSASILYGIADDLEEARGLLERSPLRRREAERVSQLINSGSLNELRAAASLLEEDQQ